MNINVLRGLNNSAVIDFHRFIHGTWAWSNVNFTVSPPNGDDPISLILRFLMSTGKGTNYPGAPATNYDDIDFNKGIGLGIPYDQIDIPSFLDVKARYDYDLNQQLYFLLTEAEPAKEFIDQELCRPFGIYLRTGNDGKIRCVRPRHPQKFNVGDTNRRLTVRYPATTGDIFNAELPIGVYTGTELAFRVAASLNEELVAVPPLQRPTFFCEYGSAKFTLLLRLHPGIEDPGEPVPFDILQSPDLGWPSLGWMGQVLDETDTTAHEERGRFVGPALTQDDLWGVEVLDNQSDRITEVSYSYDYDVDDKVYRASRTYSGKSVIPEIITIEDTFGRRTYEIRSRGLITAGAGSASWASHYRAPTSGCEAPRVDPPPEVGINADTWASLFALTLLDRYHEPPLKFRARLKWKWNHLEIGDVVKLNYSIPGVLFDSGRKMDTIQNRLFEIVELHPNFDGSLEAVFLGHRYVPQGAL